MVIDHRGSLRRQRQFIVDDAARLTAVWIADGADDAVHLSAHHARIGRDAVLCATSPFCGRRRGCGCRRTRFCSAGGDAELLRL